MIHKSSEMMITELKSFKIELALLPSNVEKFSAYTLK